jgi:hypothetical protein
MSSEVLVSLKGSLQTVALPEVLHFLSSNGKSGDFHVSDGHAEGHVWFQEGRISGFQAGAAEELFEALFELLRISDGEFTFAAGEEGPEVARCVAPEAGDLEPAMVAAQERLKEWNEIVAVVPSAAHGVRLSDAVPHKTVKLEPQQWVMVVAIGAGRTVGDVLEAMSLREFEGFKAVRALVDNKLVAVDEPVAPAVDEVLTVDEVPTVDEAPEAVAEVVQDEPVIEAVDPWAGSSDWEQPAEVEPVAEVEPFAAVEEYPVEDTGPMDGEVAISGNLLRFGTAPETDAVEDHGYEAVHFSGDYTPAAEGDEDSDDRYAALRAAIVEVGEDLVPDDREAVESDSGRVFEFEGETETDGRAALQALLSEVTDGEVDGLADRGPWSDHELSSMESDEQWSHEEHPEEVSNIVPFAPVHHVESESEVLSEDESAEEAEEAPPAEEPMNRGLLLKFLSSVRN